MENKIHDKRNHCTLYQHKTISVTRLTSEYQHNWGQKGREKTLNPWEQGKFLPVLGVTPWGKAGWRLNERGEGDVTLAVVFC